MHKPLMILFSLFPAILGLSLAFIIMKPEERTNAMVMLPVALTGIVITQYIGIRLQRKERWWGARGLIKGTQIGGLVVGVVTFVMVLFLLK
jgi:hypothetical protein